MRQFIPELIVVGVIGLAVILLYPTNHSGTPETHRRSCAKGFMNWIRHDLAEIDDERLDDNWRAAIDWDEIPSYQQMIRSDWLPSDQQICVFRLIDCRTQSGQDNGPSPSQRRVVLVLIPGLCVDLNCTDDVYFDESGVTFQGEPVEFDFDNASRPAVVAFEDETVEFIQSDSQLHSLCVESGSQFHGERAELTPVLD